MDARLSVESLPRPRRAFSYRVIDDGSGGSAGNGDGRIQKGEGVDIHLTIKNAGTAEAQNVSGKLSTAVSGDIQLYQPTFSFGALAPGEHRTATITAQVKKGTSVDTLRLDLNVSETSVEENIKETIEIPLESQAGEKVIILSARLYTGDKGGTVRTGASESTPILAPVGAGTAQDADAQLGGW
jgi:hypothetical protein